jgi:hypothetical protein
MVCVAQVCVAQVGVAQVSQSSLASTETGLSNCPDLSPNSPDLFPNFTRSGGGVTAAFHEAC